MTTTQFIIKIYLISVHPENLFWTFESDQYLIQGAYQIQEEFFAFLSVSLMQLQIQPKEIIIVPDIINETLQFELNKMMKKRQFKRKVLKAARVYNYGYPLRPF